MVDVSTSRRKADVLVVYQQDFPQVGYIKIPGHNESSLGLRGLHPVDNSIQLVRWLVSASGVGRTPL